MKFNIAKVGPMLRTDLKVSRFIFPSWKAIMVNICKKQPKLNYFSLSI